MPEMDISIIDMTIISDKALNTDGFFLAVLFLILPFLATVVFYQVVNKKYRVVSILIITALTCIPLYFENGIKFSIDVRDHLLRLQGLYIGILDRQFPVIIYPNMSNEHGQLGVLYPSLFLYIGVLLRLLGVSLYTTYKFMVVVINFAVVSVAYYCAGKLFDKKWVISIVTLVYALDPERLYFLPEVFCQKVRRQNGTALGRGMYQIPR